jgi:hypothetical protein
VPYKKPDPKRTARSSLASRLLTGALRTATPAPPSAEPWRQRKLKGKIGGQG